ncbi:DUF1361 domain-containing protein [Flavobacterium sp.]|uniref:DUF1361 domain-containing protein n=1 Tax=Flavobacterium sp. TaxID=239 RepID=UPI0039E68284
MILSYSKTHPKDASLIALAVFNLALLAFRMAVTESLYYGFLIWNLVLAAVPYLVSWYLSENQPLAQRKIPLLLFTALWLLFLPNAPYIITDFLHFKRETGMPEWFDVLLLMSFAWNGIVLGFVSMQAMRQFWHHVFGFFPSWLMVFGCTILSGFGIYLGRYLRYNSWDIVSDPIALVSDIFPLFFDLRSIGFSLGYGLFFLLAFVFFSIHTDQQKSEPCHN